MRQLAIGLMACDRAQFGKPDCFKASWDSLVASGFTGQVLDAPFAIFDAGPNRQSLNRLHVASPFVSKTWGVTPGGPRLSISSNTVRAYRWMCGQNARWCLLLHDDLQYCRNWLPKLQQLLDMVDTNDAAVWSILTPYEFVTRPENIKTGWGAWPTGGYYGDAGRAIRSDILREYLFSDESHEAEQNGVSPDLTMAYFLRRLQARVYASCPNLLGHSAATRTPRPGDDLNFTDDSPATDPFFAGADFDAMKERT